MSKTILLFLFLTVFSLGSCTLSSGRMFLAPEERAWSVNALLLSDARQDGTADRMPGYAFQYSRGLSPDLNAGLSFSLWPFGELIMYLSPYISYQSMHSPSGWALRHSLSYSFWLDYKPGGSWLKGPHTIHLLTLSTIPAWSGSGLSLYMPLDISLSLASAGKLSLILLPGIGVSSMGPWRLSGEYSLGVSTLAHAKWRRMSVARLGLSRVYTNQ